MLLTVSTFKELISPNVLFDKNKKKLPQIEAKRDHNELSLKVETGLE